MGQGVGDRCSLMDFIDVFAGVGGFRLPLEQLGHRCVWSCDIDKYAEMVYRYNFGGKGYDARDIRKVGPRAIPDFDIFCGGFPCPDFSIAGGRQGLEGTRGQLFYEITRIARDKRPSYLFLENVKGLLSSNGGWDFAQIQIELGELGYDLQWQVLNSKNYGVPQNRERIFIIGNLRGIPRAQVFPIQENDKIPEGPDGSESTQFQALTTRPVKTKVDRKDDTFIIDRKGNRKNKDQASTLMGGGHSGGNHRDMDLIQMGNVDTKGHNSLWGRVYDPEGLATNLNAEGGGLGAKTGLYRVHNLQGRSANRPALSDNPNAGGHGYLNRDDEKVYSLERSNLQAIESNNNIRRLTPLECERLQGFPDNWTKTGLNEDGEEVTISDTQRYKMMGNAVTVNVIRAIGERLMI